MKNIGVLLVLIGMLSCTENQKVLTLTNSTNQKELGHKLNGESFSFGDGRLYALQKVNIPEIETETFTKTENGLSLHYTYPALNETINPLWKSFNNYIKETYINNENSVEKILKNDALSCDPLYEDATRIKRSVDYKVYTKNKGLLSILLYKTNYYDDQYHNSFMFKGLNYDLIKGTFITYQDVFVEGSEKILLFKLNQELEAWKTGEDSFNDCWKFTGSTFADVKNNFVINETNVRFYFDDCAVCPTYTGNHYLEIPLDELTHIMKSTDDQKLKKG